jgi:excisionase family DNA binding protein
MKRLMSVEEAAKRLGVSLWVVYRLARSGRLQSIRLGRRRLFSDADLAELIRSSRSRNQRDPRKSCAPR